MQRAKIKLLWEHFCQQCLSSQIVTLEQAALLIIYMCVCVCVYQSFINQSIILPSQPCKVPFTSRLVLFFTSFYNSFIGE